MHRGQRAMTIRRFCILLGAATIGLHAIPGRAQAESVKDTALRCKALGEADFSQLLDAPTQLLETKPVAPHGDMPGFCQVSGYVTPNVGFLLRLPLSTWNGKFIE